MNNFEPMRYCPGGVVQGGLPGNSLELAALGMTCNVSYGHNTLTQYKFETINLSKKYAKISNLSNQNPNH